MSVYRKCAHCGTPTIVNSNNEYGTCSQRCRRWAIKLGLPKMNESVNTRDFTTRYFVQRKSASDWVNVAYPKADTQSINNTLKYCIEEEKQRKFKAPLRVIRETTAVLNRWDPKDLTK